MARITLNSSLTFAEAFDNFIFHKTAQGVTDKTISCYKSHFKSISNYLDTSIELSTLNKITIQKMISEMRQANLSPNTIASYVRVLNAFLSWARDENLCNLTISRYKTEETIKDTYTDDELALLLKKPNLSTVNFSEYRTWVIINFIMNSGARASTIRNILIGDLDLENGFVTYRHNKNHKVQIIPLCTQMTSILKEYLFFRKGVPSDYLFCSEDNEMLTEYALRNSIARYNNRRGVTKTSIHLFRHTFAKKYLIDCGGDAFTLQRILGHSTLDMTRHYCNIYNVDLVKNYDSFSPLQQLTSKEKRITLKQD